MSGRRAEMALLSAERVVHPGLTPRLRAWSWQRVSLALTACWRAASLDRQLAAGASPRASPLLALRAQRITGRRSRVRVADGLRRAIGDAQTSTPGFSAAARPHRHELLAARTVISTLEHRLRAAEPVSARGVALLRTLLSDGTGPLYRPRERGALGSELRAAAAALEPEGGCEQPSVGVERRQGP
jgi:hypothetical protein